MKKIILAAAILSAASGAAFAQEAPYTVMNGQVKYPGQMQWNAPTAAYGAGPYVRGDVYYGGASARVPVPNYGDTAGYADGYNQAGPGVFVFDGENVNLDQNYNGR